MNAPLWRCLYLSIPSAGMICGKPKPRPSLTPFERCFPVSNPSHETLNLFSTKATREEEQSRILCDLFRPETFPKKPPFPGSIGVQGPPRSSRHPSSVVPVSDDYCFPSAVSETISDLAT